VGFGFGAIQAGLFLYEAQQSGAFDRYVVAEVVPDVVSALRAADGYYTVNIAHHDRVEQARVGPVEVYNPQVAEDRSALVAAIAAAHEMATALPSVAYYTNDEPGSIHRLLAQGLVQKTANGGSRALLYAAENNNHAAEILAVQVGVALDELRLDEGARAQALAQICFTNTVIGKMSGSVAADGALAPVTPGSLRAFLVEEFSRILIGRVNFANAHGTETAPFVRGIQIFSEKDDLLPFEEAKLYGHNAMHALAAYLGWVAGKVVMSELVELPGLLPFVRGAVLKEPGAALIHKYADLHDPLFTADGFAAYVDDLIVRMINPFLSDAIARVGRDPQRKLAWDDRLIGSMRLRGRSAAPNLPQRAHLSRWCSRGALAAPH
jgi:mannitol-1-phosphate 5-dehydrogenase